MADTDAVLSADDADFWITDVHRYLGSQIYTDFRMISQIVNYVTIIAIIIYILMSLHLFLQE